MNCCGGSCGDACVDKTVQSCPECGESMIGVRGRKDAVCRNCGFKDSCCF